MEGNIGQKCDWIVPYCFVFGDAMNLPVRYYVVPGRILYRNSDGIISYPVTQSILRHAIISYPVMICRTQWCYIVPLCRTRWCYIVPLCRTRWCNVVPGDAMSYSVMQCRTRWCHIVYVRMPANSIVSGVFLREKAGSWHHVIWLALRVVCSSIASFVRAFEKCRSKHLRKMFSPERWKFCEMPGIHYSN